MSERRRSSSPKPCMTPLKLGQRLPIVYHLRYNIHFCLLEKFHPLDGCKWAKTFKKLTEIGITEDHIYLSREATKEELLYGNTEKHLRCLKNSWNIAASTDIFILGFLPNSYVQKQILRPLRYQAYGTLLAGQLALSNGWAINIGGGFHQASSNSIEGLGLYADITMLVNYALSEMSERVKKVMIVDLDAHQGIGFESDFLNHDKVFIMDVYNYLILPNDPKAKDAIKCKVELQSRTRDFEYLTKVETNFLKSLNTFTPDLVIYNAGTCILEGDVGRLSITPAGIIKRDQLLFVVCRQRKLPIVMLGGGGFLRKASTVTADSIKNLFNLKIIGNE